MVHELVSNLRKELAGVAGCAVAESMMTVKTGSYLQHSCDWDRQTFWSPMRMVLSRSRTG
ncbi:putative tail fiber protein [Escherichia coli 95.0083]|nr:putative tail fiber protein [Escherichia coli 95.0083]